jgi:hypothetical protein
MVSAQIYPGSVRPYPHQGQLIFKQDELLLHEKIKIFLYSSISSGLAVYCWPGRRD